MKKNSWGALVIVLFIYFFFKSCLGCGGGSSSGPFSASDVERITRNELMANGYDNPHIISEECVNQTEDEVTYNFEAEFDYLGVKNTQSGFVYFYKNGDLKDFRLRNDIHVVE